jgi:beta-glucosidase
VTLETKLKIPNGFMIGAASAAHQVEGGNTNSDWWHAEQQGRLPKSGVAADHYNRFNEDFSIAESIGLDAMRIGIEWARIEPREGEIDQAAVRHYREVLNSMEKHHLAPVITLFHNTLPQWVLEKGGVLWGGFTKAFAKFAELMVKEFGQEVKYWITINEPEMYARLPYLKGIRPPFHKNIFQLVYVFWKLAQIHNSVYAVMKKTAPDILVSVAKNNVHFEAYRPQNFLDQLTVAVSHYFTNSYFLNRIKNHIDFIGLNYYFYNTLTFDFVGGARHMNNEGPRSDMGWRTYPEGIYHVLKDLQQYQKPILITENGIANARDDMRRRFIKEHIMWALKAREEGVDVRGYFYWSLTDTYEWEDGFNPKFGLVEINFENQQRRVRPSATVFREEMTR